MYLCSMQYIEISFSNVNEEQQDILVALLSDAGYEGFVQGSDTLQAYIEESLFNEAELKELSLKNTYTSATIAKQNWNATWEANFQPVIVEGFCTIRADFHNIPVTTTHEIIITPKMSFGTGHHATTQLVMLMMRDLDMAGKSVFDFGTGTGVLAVLAEKLGAAYILGIDNDEWSVENATENIERNHCHKITIQQNNTDILAAGQFDVILANINRHILLQYMPQLFAATVPGGTVLMSGLLTTDREIIVNAAKENNLQPLDYRELNNWISLSFTKV